MEPYGPVVSEPSVPAAHYAASDVPTIASGAVGSEGMADLVDPRDHAGQQRDQVGEERDVAARLRDRDGDQRDLAGSERDQAGGRRDMIARRRDRAAKLRDLTAVQRDWAAKLRDEAADQRDEVAELFEASPGTGATPAALSRSARARSEAAADRSHAARDRVAAAGERADAELDRQLSLADRGFGAGERADAELDRNIALTDRGSGAGERTDAETDRSLALADRRASSTEREYAALDDLTGAYLRGAGLLALRHEIARTQRTQVPLIAAFIDVDHLKEINDSRGHAAGDDMLVAVARALRSRLRAYDLVIRYGGDEFVVSVAGLTLADAAQRFALLNASLGEAPGGGSVSVGLAELRPNDLPEELVGRADAALYRDRQQARARRPVPQDAPS